MKGFCCFMGTPESQTTNPNHQLTIKAVADSSWGYCPSLILRSEDGLEGESSQSERDLCHVFFFFPEDI